MSESRELSTLPVHLGRGAMVTELAAFDGTPGWYQAYEEFAAADGAEGWLVSLHTFDSSWSSWEMHPAGHELVVCVKGELVLLQERDGQSWATTLREGQWALNTPGTWHTADLATGTESSCLFITSGLGTQVRDR